MRFWALILLLSLNVSCVPAFLGKSTPDPVEPGSVLFADDFSHPPSGWGTWHRDDASVEYWGDGLRIQVMQPQFDFWSVAGQNFRDAQIEVDAVRIAGPEDNDFGLLCRYQDKSNFYLLVVSSDGYFGIAKMKTGQYSMIGADQLQYSQAIAGSHKLNHLRADCTGPRLTLYANGQKLMEARDDDFQSGDVGVMAGAYNEAGVDIYFDNFVVKQP